MISTPGSESFKEFKQVEFSGTGIIPSIPELSTWAMMLTGFVGYRASRRENARGETRLPFNISESAADPVAAALAV